MTNKTIDLLNIKHKVAEEDSIADFWDTYVERKAKKDKQSMKELVKDASGK